jgi:hypothetical protein
MTTQPTRLEVRAIARLWQRATDKAYKFAELMAKGQTK